MVRSLEGNGLMHNVFRGGAQLLEDGDEVLGCGFSLLPKVTLSPFNERSGRAVGCPLG